MFPAKGHLDPGVGQAVDPVARMQDPHMFPCSGLQKLMMLETFLGPFGFHFFFFL